MKKKILIVTPFIPYPLNSGGNIAQFVFIDKLQTDFNLYLLFPLNNIDDNYSKLSAIWPNVTLIPFKETFLLKSKRYILQKIPSFIDKYLTILFANNKTIDLDILYNSKIFESSKYYIDNEFVRFIEDVIVTYHIDFVQVEFYEFISLGELLKTNVKKIFVHHEIRYIRESREITLLNFTNNCIQRFLSKNKMYEISKLKFYDNIVTLSKNDVEELQNHLPFNKIYSSPVPIFSALNSQVDTIPVEFSNKLVFLGGGSHFPNVDGLNWFIDHAWETIKQDFPNINLYVVGSWPDEKIQKYKCDTRINYLGFVQDLRSILIGSIFIIPIRIGSGIRMKIAEAVKLDCPIISTTVGIEGISLEPNTDYLLSDTPFEFVKSVKALVENPELYKMLINNSKNKFNRDYSFDILIQNRKNVYN